MKKVLKKHTKLAQQLSKNATWQQVQSYISSYRKYDDWTLRDIDIVMELLRQKQ